MNNDRLPIDDLFKQALEDYSQEAPSNHVWSVISRKLILYNVTKLSAVLKMNTWAAISGAAAVIATCIFIISQQSDKQDQISNNTPQGQQNIYQPTDTMAVDNSFDTTASFISSNEDQSFPLSQSLNSKDNQVPKELEVGQQKIQSHEAEPVFERNAVTHDKTIENIIQENKQVDIVTDRNVIQEEKQNNKSEEVTINEKPLAEKTEIIQSQQIDEEQKITKLALKEIEIDTVSKVLQEDGLFKRKKTTASVKYDYRHWSIDIFTSFNFNSKKSEWSVPVFQNYYNYTNKESVGISNDFGIEVRYKTRPGLVLKTGLNYNSFSDKNEIDFMYKELDTLYFIYVDTFWVHNPNPYDPNHYIRVIDTMHFISVDSFPRYKNLNSINQYHYFEIPLLVGWSYKYKKVDLELTGGLSFGFLTGSSLWYYDPKRGYIQSEGKSFPLRKTLLNLNLRLSAVYNFNDNVGFIFGPAYRQNLNSIFEDDYPLDQRFKSVGVQFGLRYRF